MPGNHFPSLPLSLVSFSILFALSGPSLSGCTNRALESVTGTGVVQRAGVIASLMSYYRTPGR